MPRNASGNYSLPLPPVVPDTIIESDWANDTLDDLAQAVTDSLDRYGRGSMAGPFRTVDGTVGVPGLSWISETSTGFYRPSAGNIAFSVLGNQVANIDANGVTLKGVLQIANGIGAGPAQVEIGSGRTVDGPAYIDFTSSTGSPDFNLRILRADGVNGSSSFVHKGTGNLNIQADDAASLVMLTNSTQRLIVTPDGRFYGTAIHNNPGSVAGTVNQYFASGTYVPGIADVLNVSSIHSIAARWIRVGNVITVSLVVQLGTAGAAFSQVIIPLPISGANSGDYLAGVAVLNPPGSIFSGTVTSNAAGALLSFVASAAATHDTRVVFTYVLL